MDFKCFFEGDQQGFNDHFFAWLSDAQNRLQTSWNLEDACLNLVLIENQFNEGLISEKETDLKQRDVFYRSRLKLSDLIHCFYGHVLASTHRNDFVKNFIIYDHLIQKYERTESARLEDLYAQFSCLLPHLEKFKYELCFLCAHFNRPYRLPQSYWNDYKKHRAYSATGILMSWLERKRYTSIKSSRSLARFRYQALDYHQLCKLRKLSSRRQKYYLQALDLPCSANDFFQFIEQFRIELLECCGEIEIIERFIILDAFLAIGEEWFLVDQDFYTEVFSTIKDHLLNAFSLEELKDFIQTFARPYVLLDG